MLLPSDEERLILLEKLGGGAAYETWMAGVADPQLRQEYGDSRVAVKVFRNRSDQDQLFRDLASLGRLDARLHARERREFPGHPRLATILGLAVVQGRTVAVMEYIPGGSLRAEMGEGDHQHPLAPGRAVALAIAVLEALQILHAEHVAHSGVKPQNVLMDARGPRLADVGLARWSLAATPVSTLAGTTAYIAPEVLEGADPTPASDLWSAGILLYEMLAGRLPFEDPHVSPAELLRVIRSGRMLSLNSAAPGVSPSLASVVARALTPQARARCGAAEMRQALERLGLQDDATIANPESAPSWDDLFPVSLPSPAGSEPPAFTPSHGTGLGPVETREVAGEAPTDSEEFLSGQDAPGYPNEPPETSEPHAFPEEVGPGDLLIADPGQVTALRERISAGADAGALEGEINALLDAHPDDPAVWACAGDYFTRQHRTAEAADAYQAAIAKGGESAAIRWRLGAILASLGRRADAMTSIEKALAIGLDPEEQRKALLLLISLRRAP